MRFDRLEAVVDPGGEEISIVDWALSTASLWQLKITKRVSTVTLLVGMREQHQPWSLQCS